MARKRDSQRQKVYDSEPEIPRGKTFETIEECQAYVDQVLARKRLAERTRHIRHIQVLNRRAGTTATAGHRLSGMVINLPSNLRYERMLLHEVAHHVSHGTGHDWQFCDTHLALVREMMGVAVHDELKAQYKMRKVKFRKPRTRTLTPEQRQAAADRLAQAREARMARQTRGRFVLRVLYSDWDYYVSVVTMKWDAPRMTLTRSTDNAQVWTTREAVERWEKNLTNEGYAVQIVELD